MAYANGRFVAVGGEGTIVYSSDGDLWEEATLTVESERLFGVAGGGPGFVAVGRNAQEPHFLHSADGTSWTEASATAATAPLDAVAWGGTRFVAVGARRNDRP